MPTLTIIHPQIKVNSVKNSTQYSKVYVTGHKQKSHIKTAYISDWFWLRLHPRRNLSSRKIEFERDVEVYSDNEEN